MDVKQAVQLAKTHLTEIFSDESIANIGLEEVDFDDLNQVWEITIGFSRFWGRMGDVISALDGNAARTFKVVRIKDETGDVLSVKHRHVTTAR